jgi:tetratricopeptide (TPR) repeat protein
VKTDYNRHIPNGSQVSVVLTTRLSDARKYASSHPDPQDVERKKLFLRLDGLDPGSAVDLVLEASDIEERSPEIIDQATQIVTALDFHPLALNAASSLIRSAVYSLEEYADALEDRLTQKELLETESEQARYLKVSTTFEVSTDSLQSLASTDPTAKAALALLDILGFMHHQDISEGIFVRAWEYEKEVLSEFDAEDGDILHLSAWHVTQCQSIFSSLPTGERIHLFRKARALLGRLSLLNMEQSERRMSLHLLVRKWARERVARPSETWTAVASILALSTQGEFSWQPFTSQLVSHLETVFDWQKSPMSRTISDQWGLCRILYVSAWQMECAHSTRSLKICLQLDIQTQELPCDYFSAATAKFLLGRAHLENGQLSEAIDILERLANLQGEISESERLAAQQSLALVYGADGQNTKAIEILERIVKVREKLREDHPDRLASQHALAVAYWSNGQTEKALEIQQSIVIVGRRVLRADNCIRITMEKKLSDFSNKTRKECIQNEVLPVQNESEDGDHSDSDNKDEDEDEDEDEDDDEELSSNQSEKSELPSRIIQEGDGYDYNEQYEGDDEDESDNDDGDHEDEDEDEDANENDDEELSSIQGASESVTSINHFRRRRTKLALR